MMMQSPNVRHTAVVYHKRSFKDLFRKTYWIGCWSPDCDLNLGPLGEHEAIETARVLRGSFGDGKLFCDE